MAKVKVKVLKKRYRGGPNGEDPDWESLGKDLKHLGVSAVLASLGATSFAENPGIVIGGVIAAVTAGVGYALEKYHREK